MDQLLEKLILDKTGGTQIERVTLIQKLWSSYGEILRVDIAGCSYKSVVVKHVKLPESETHPRGWNTDNSHNRKVQSYKVETSWYRSWADKCDASCVIPNCIGIDRLGDEIIMILEDLNDSGFPIRKTSLTLDEIKLTIRWIANFHGTFINETPTDLWDKGTYWHLDTRPDELKALKDKKLKSAAKDIDKLLENTTYKTIVHGDAKLANFCYSEDCKSVAAVDFQYVGGGVGIKDLAYFIGSCLYEEQCESLEEQLLSCYFSALRERVESLRLKIDMDLLEESWRKLYPVAWTDFHRFLKGWSPGHWKINSYSERLSKEVLGRL